MTRLLFVAALLMALGGSANAAGSGSNYPGTTELPATRFDESWQPPVRTKPDNNYVGEFGVPAEKRFLPFNADLPGCDDHDTIWWIKNRFDHTQSTFWNSSLEIVNIDRIQEIGFRSNGASYIPRRYCVGRAELSDKKFHTVIYQIQERTGVPAGYNYGNEWCVIGYDHDFAYAPACSVLRPLIDRYANDNYVLPAGVNLKAIDLQGSTNNK